MNTNFGCTVDARSLMRFLLMTFCPSALITPFNFDMISRSCWPRVLRRRSAVARWDCGFESRLRHGGFSSLNVVCCAGIGLCHGPILHQEESYRGVCMCHLQRAPNKKKRILILSWDLCFELLVIYWWSVGGVCQYWQDKRPINNTKWWRWGVTCVSGGGDTQTAY